VACTRFTGASLFTVLSSAIGSGRGRGCDNWIGMGVASTVVPCAHLCTGHTASIRQSVPPCLRARGVHGTVSTQCESRTLLPPRGSGVVTRARTFHITLRMLTAMGAVTAHGRTALGGRTLPEPQGRPLYLNNLLLIIWRRGSPCRDTARRMTEPKRGKRGARGSALLLRRRETGAVFTRVDNDRALCRVLGAESAFKEAMHN